MRKLRKQVNGVEVVFSIDEQDKISYEFNYRGNCEGVGYSTFQQAEQHCYRVIEEIRKTRNNTGTGLRYVKKTTASPQPVD